VGRVLSTLVDVGRVVFLRRAVGLTIQMMQRMGSLQMTIIDLPMNIIYGHLRVGFAAATIRSVQVHDRELAARLGACSSSPSTRSRNTSNESHQRGRRAAQRPRCPGGRRAQRVSGGTRMTGHARSPSSSR
jgi:hypothetical protein